MKLESRKYTSRDFEVVKSWFKARNMGGTEKLLPKTGFIVPGIAAGFLINTDTKSCIFEPFISNPESAWIYRNEALNLIMEQLINEARLLGYTHIFGFASHGRMLKRAISWGFIKVEDSITIVKELN